jgi:hypothetical protein
MSLDNNVGSEKKRKKGILVKESRDNDYVWNLESHPYGAEPTSLSMERHSIAALIITDKSPIVWSLPIECFYGRL